MEINKERIHITSRSFCQSQELISRLKSLGYEPILWNQQEQLHSFLKEARWLIVGTERIDKSLLEGLPSLKGISKYGVGTDNLDFKALTELNIKIALHPGTNRLAVAEYALGLLLNGLHKIHKTSSRLKQSSWQKDGGQNLSTKSIGIIGLGNVGSELVRLLSPFNCHILVHEIDPFKKNVKNSNLHFVNFETVLTNSHAVSLHLPLTPDSFSLINERTLKLMKPDSILINTSRGELVQHDDMLNHLKMNKDFQYLADTHVPEPYLGEMLLLENFLGTPHSAGNSAEAIQLMGLAAIEGINNLIGEA